MFVIDEGQRTYIERINVRGNTRTRDYVIRREFDIVEGDAYNRALVDRAERRLKNLDYFKSVKITNEPGSPPDRVILNVDLEEKSTGDFSVSGGYSTADGVLGEVSVAERNLLGRGLYAKAARSVRTVCARAITVARRTVLARLSRGARSRHVRSASSSPQLRVLQLRDSVASARGSAFGCAKTSALQLRYSISGRKSACRRL